MFQYLLKSTLFLIGLSLMTACGKNPLDRSNDPTEKFGNLGRNASEYQQLENKEAEKLKYEKQLLQNELDIINKERQNSQSACGRIYDLNVLGTEGGRLDFVENVSKSYKINVRSYLTNDYVLQIEKTPENSLKITKTDKDGEWLVTWQPSSGLISERETFFTGPLNIAFIPKSASSSAQRCLNSKYVENFSVTVALDQTQPVLSVQEIQQNFKSKDGQATIHLQVSDPAATSNQPPLAVPVSVDASNAQTALPTICGNAKPSTTAHTWTYECTVSFFNLNSRIQAAKNGDVLQGIVAFKAISQRTGRNTPVVPKVVSVVVDEPSKEIISAPQPEQALTADLTNSTDEEEMNESDLKIQAELEKVQKTGKTPAPTARPAN